MWFRVRSSVDEDRLRRQIEEYERKIKEHRQVRDKEIRERRDNKPTEDKELPPLRTWNIYWEGGGFHQVQAHYSDIEDETEDMLFFRHTTGSWTWCYSNWRWHWRRELVLRVARYIMIEEVRES
jgi:hypothetical protein